MAWTKYGEGNLSLPMRLLAGLGACAGDNTPGKEMTARFEQFQTAYTNIVSFATRTINEGDTLRVQVYARDPDEPKQTLVFGLGSDAPGGAKIDPASGAFSWTPSEAQGPGVYPITVRVTDNGEPPLSTERTLTATVNEVNSPPQLKTIPSQTATEGQLFSLQAEAVDSDWPTNHLAFGLGPNAPAGMTIDSDTGLISWTPDETQGGSNFQVTVTVTDNGTPPLRDSKLFSIEVSEANLAPVLAPIPDISVDERTELNHTVVATDSDLPVQKLTFGLGTNAPTGVTISALGVLHWQPTEAQGPGVYPVTVRVTDNGQPPLSAEQTFTVTVNEVNLAPVLEPIADQKAEVSHELQFTATATDSDLPPNVFTFSLDPGAPDGAKIDPATGVFSWTPTSAQAPSTNSVTVRVTDNGTPLLSDTKAFRVAVLGPFVELRIVGAPTVVNGQFTFSWQAQAGRRYRVQFKDSLDITVPWQDSSVAITASESTATFQSDSSMVSGDRFYRVHLE